jgi:hypothetical protein
MGIKGHFACIFVFQRDPSGLTMDREQPDCRLQESGVVTKKSYSTVFTLPSIRYANVVKAIVFIDGVLSLALWVTGERTLQDLYLTSKKKIMMQEP